MQLGVEEVGMSVRLGAQASSLPTKKLRQEKKKSGHYRKIALIAHGNRVLLRALQKRLHAFLIPEQGPHCQSGGKNQLNDI